MGTPKLYLISIPILITENNSLIILYFITGFFTCVSACRPSIHFIFTLSKVHNMEQHHTPVSQITPQTKRWTAKVEVLEKTFPRLSKGGGQYQRLILIDSQGTCQKLQR